MGRLKDISVDFAQLCQYDYEYELSSGDIITLSMEKSNLPHLIGLHKLIDIDILRRLEEKKVSGSEVYRKMKKETITDEEVFNSVHFNKISDRLKHISNLESLLFDRIILNFDKTKITTKIKSQILMYREIDGQYVHLALILSQSGTYFPETLLVQNDDYYINNQIELEVDRLIIKRRGSIVQTFDYKNIDIEAAVDKNKE